MKFDSEPARTGSVLPPAGQPEQLTQVPLLHPAQEVPALALANARMLPAGPPLAGPSEPAVILHFGQELVTRLEVAADLKSSVSTRVIVDQVTGKDVRSFPADQDIHFGRIGEQDHRPVFHSDGSYVVPLEPRLYREPVVLKPGDQIVTSGEFGLGMTLESLSLIVRRQNGDEQSIRIPHGPNGGPTDRFLDIRYEK